ncbi:hypothetical protein [Nocardioides sp.]|uniref:hypothetical protein n=1 Tax=Nocardioides sp. TaxID=35761 RepID=UPI0026296924|nr:hypothetical protein [Nocardioides sp.]MDI6908459.1 hypothetical protein [Nocardioides sp.]
MYELGAVTWLIAIAVMIILILAVGTLAAAGMLGRDEATPVPVLLEEEAERDEARR